MLPGGDARAAVGAVVVTVRIELLPGAADVGLNEQAIPTPVGVVQVRETGLLKPPTAAIEKVKLAGLPADTVWLG